MAEDNYSVEVKQEGEEWVVYDEGERFERFNTADGAEEKAEQLQRIKRVLEVIRSDIETTIEGHNLSGCEIQLLKEYAKKRRFLVWVPGKKE